MCAQLGWVAALTAAGEVLGAHLEGPFLSAPAAARRTPRHLLTPTRSSWPSCSRPARTRCARSPSRPSCPARIELIRDIVAAGAIAAVGHTDATYEQAAAGFAAGATLATHLFNAMGSMSQRAPGPAIAALDAGAYVELINDGVHVHEALTRLAVASGPAEGWVGSR